MVVFCFHRVSDERSPAYPPMPVKVFDRICSHIRRRYAVVPFEALGERLRTRKRRALMTFDDGYYDFYENALPILSKYHFPSVQHVITSCVETGESPWTQQLNKIVEAYHEQKQPLFFDNKRHFLTDARSIERTAIYVYMYMLRLSESERNALICKLSEGLAASVSYTRMMDSAMLRESVGYDVHIGSHTVSHTNLTLLDDETLAHELTMSKQYIVANIGDTQGKTLAYPNGQYNDKVLSAMELSGYRYGFTTDGRLFVSGGDSRLVPRLMLYHRSFIKNYLNIKRMLFFN